MAQYEVLADSVIGSGLVKAGAIIEYDGKSEGKPGANLRLVKSAVRTAKVVDGAEEPVEIAPSAA
ncbi:MAG: hypothetical protein PHW13_11920 [Methylococcales bacterium]|nr:hypothetical protein [Methylococcales bacterium]